MDCSWTVYAITDNPEISLGTPCDKNTYAWTSINSDEFLQLYTIAHSNTPNISKVRVGFVVIDSSELNLKHFITYPNIDSKYDWRDGQVYDELLFPTHVNLFFLCLLNSDLAQSQYQFHTFLMPSPFCIYFSYR